ncbi:hypothetical protein GP486_006664 [Trichoglossum hirsutum]|uniref:GPR1/FUN34/YaaH-class plasma membrane protein n=1 Tax=Trichoglossum hirsutum TaxID=265104 RepID=A0A9P8L7R9_9PEZI|nr:hypothetical protein GP486_006664 [Trichoglossum hirsutum]
MAHKSSISLHEYSVENSFDLGPRNHNIRSEETLPGSRAPGTISISLALFEKLTQQRSLDDVPSKHGNPAPVALLGNLLSLSPLACDLMGWRDTRGHGYASTGVYMFMGGLLMIIGSVMEYYLGDTFSFVVFAALGGFWLSFAATLIPWFNAAGYYSKSGTDPIEGAANPAYQSGFAFFLLFMGVLCLVFLVCSLRTNIVLVVIFVTLTVAFPMLSGADWQAAQGNLLLAQDLQKIAAAFLFVTSIAGWYAFVGSMLQALDFPFDLPMGALHIIPSGSDKRKLKGEDV